MGHSTEILWRGIKEVMLTQIRSLLEPISLAPSLLCHHGAVPRGYLRALHPQTRGCTNYACMFGGHFRAWLVSHTESRSREKKSLKIHFWYSWYSSIALLFFFFFPLPFSLILKLSWPSFCSCWKTLS